MTLRGRLAAARRALGEGWERLLDTPGGQGRVARGIAAGAFAAMMPAFGLHLVLAALVALLLRGSFTAAGAACLLLGNPLTHAVLVPTELAIGRLFLPPHRRWVPAHPPAWLPHWVLEILPGAEDALLGGLLLGAVVSTACWFLARRALASRARHHHLVHPVIRGEKGPV
ncbi:DUF2062 domain-containing protein [Roseomonas elaeocarpi]|uniref:DUF2062 domain-containing protein n=1 Tax=Roseomonas elaeocarpi TaxID=907779 RepID=A0ABV6K028_9PROT